MAVATNGDSIRPGAAAKLLRCSYDTILRYVTAGKLRADRPLGRGPGKRMTLSRAEVLALRAKLRAEG